MRAIGMQVCLMIVYPTNQGTPLLLPVTCALCQTAEVQVILQGTGSCAG